MASSGLLRDGASISSSSLLALARKSYLPDPPHFLHGLLVGTLIRSYAYLPSTIPFSGLRTDCVRRQDHSRRVRTQRAGLR